MEEKKNIALFIDADNGQHTKIDIVLSDLATLGVVNIRRAYGDWDSNNLNGWKDCLHEYAIRPMQQYALTKKKNASDMALVIDVMDILYTKNIDIIGIFSSDSDFTPLVRRILEEGKEVIGFGSRKTPDPFVKACSRFLYLDDQVSIDIPAMFIATDDAHVEVISETKKSSNSLKSDTKLINLLRQAIEAVEGEDGWANLGRVGNHISNQTSFDQRNYGFKKLKDLFDAIDLFELEGVGKVWSVRDKRKAKVSSKAE